MYIFVENQPKLTLRSLLLQFLQLSIKNKRPAPTTGHFI